MSDIEAFGKYCHQPDDLNVQGLIPISIIKIIQKFLVGITVGEYSQTLQSFKNYLVASGPNGTLFDWDNDELDYEKLRPAIKFIYTFFFKLYSGKCELDPDGDWCDSWYSDVETVLNPFKAIEEYQSAGCKGTFLSKFDLAKNLTALWNRYGVAEKKGQFSDLYGQYELALDHSDELFRNASVMTYFSILQGYLGIDNEDDVMVLLNLVAYHGERDKVFASNSTETSLSCLDLPKWRLVAACQSLSSNGSTDHKFCCLRAQLSDQGMRDKLLHMFYLSTTPNFECVRVMGQVQNNQGECWKRVINENGICHVASLGKHVLIFTWQCFVIKI